MEKTEEKNEQQKVASNSVDEAVLKYLADNHPDDEAALEQITQLLGGEVGERLIAAVYDGLHYAGDVAAADAAGYLRGRNEAVEQKRREQDMYPKDDGGVPDDYDLPLLRTIRRSVWD